jgi:hypothetical protein
LLRLLLLLWREPMKVPHRYRVFKKAPVNGLIPWLTHLENKKI